VEDRCESDSVSKEPTSAKKAERCVSGRTGQAADISRTFRDQTGRIAGQVVLLGGHDAPSPFFRLC
jgi:hypothetical protein